MAKAGDGATGTKWPVAAPVFGATAKASSGDGGATGADAEDGEDAAGGHEGEEADVHFDAIVKLEKVQELKTGEEGWTTLFSEGGKLYRWGEGNAGPQWKERAKGTIKLLQCADDASKVRFVV